ncbi:MAG: sigma-54-dependent Fis family transcriptional regulator [Opitutaceae bacterium]|nr:sigma-54-dependent Fis family transcriptional regulator [Opitutaceae bacterium]
MLPTVLIVDDEKHTREGLRQALEEQYDIYLAQDADQAFNLMESEQFDVVITDLRMPGGKSGLKVIDRALTLPNRPVVIMMTAYGNVESAVEAMKRGATDFLTKPVNLEKLEILIQRALKSRTLETENKQLHERLDAKFNLEGIVGNSTALQQVVERVKLVAPSRATILISGETGTGKELIAQAVHQLSQRSKAAFVAVHCAALPANLLESELFGHERGSFTGATERRIGRFESADGGTLFLDEIGEINLTTQVKLLRFLEQRTFERIGSSKSITVDVRLIAATNRNLEQMVKEGTFREDLYFRLNVVQVAMPPLRERTDDIPLLLDHFLKSFAKENGIEPPVFEAGAMRCLQAYPWPGNIRELRNFAENAVVLHRSARIHEYDLEPKFRGGTGVLQGSVGEGGAAPGAATAGTSGGLAAPRPGPLSVEENEKKLLREALLQARGNRTRAAKLLGISRRTLHRKLVEWPELDVIDR